MNEWPSETNAMSSGKVTSDTEKEEIQLLEIGRDARVKSSKKRTVKLFCLFLNLHFFLLLPEQIFWKHPTNHVPCFIL